MNFSFLIKPVHWLWLVCILLQLALVFQTTNAQTKECRLNTFRLPRRIQPRHYELLVKPDLALKVYEGQVRIDLQVVGDERCTSTSDHSFGCQEDQVVLNSKLLDIKEAKYFVDGPNGRHLQVRETCFDRDNEFFVMKLNEKLPVGSHGLVEINFSGRMSENDYKGFYMDSYEDQLNMTQPSGVTHFEAHYARRAFPCFDEPQFKATFSVAIEHPQRLTAVSNMELKEQLPVKRGDQSDALEPLVQSRFKQTPIMSTYLLAFALGEYDHLESVIMDGKLKLRVLTAPKMAQKAQFALDTARRAYVALNDYFQIEQPLQKIDFISVRAIKASAMENWGLITTNRDYLIQDELTTTPLMHAHSAVVIAHELAHQWFGNLVTMKWWNNLWLNEAFAEWISYEIANRIYPEYNYHFLYLQESFMKGLKADADMGTHQIRNPHLESMEQIESSFDDITYKKGAAVVKMLASFMGEENFKLAIRDYIKSHSYGNTDAVDLWSALKVRSGLPIGQLMHSWLDQPGLPVLDVTFASNSEASSPSSILIKQQRFMRQAIKTESGKPEEQNKQLWHIPISMLVSNANGDKSEQIKFIMNEEEKQLDLPDWFDAAQGHWFKLNVDFDGFYRVNYHFEVLKLMHRALEAKIMAPIDRLNVLDDIMAMYSFGRIELDQVELFLSWMKNENHAGVIYTMSQLIEMLRELSFGSEDFNQHLLLVDYCDNQLNGFRFNSTTERVIEARARLSTLLTLVHSNYEPIVKEAMQIFDQSDNGQVPVEIREPVYAAVAQKGSPEQVERLRDILASMDDGLSKKTLINSMLAACEWDRKDEITRKSF